MDIAKTKRRENIAEYILYLWQLEDLLRALQFSPEAIHSTLIAPRKDIAEEQKPIFLMWYLDIATLLRQEGKEEKGHLEHTLHLIQELHDLHLQLMKLPVGAHYRTTYARLEPELPRLRELVGNPGMSDTELCFRALYAAMLYRIKGEGGKGAVADTLEFVSPAIAERCTARSSGARSICSATRSSAGRSFGADRRFRADGGCSDGRGAFGDGRVRIGGACGDSRPVVRVRGGSRRGLRRMSCGDFVKRTDDPGNRIPGIFRVGERRNGVSGSCAMPAATPA